MKRTRVELLFPDNGGVVIHHTPVTEGTKSPTYNPRQKLYMCPSLDPAEVGTVLMAMLADLRITEAGMAAVDLDREVGEIQF